MISCVLHKDAFRLYANLLDFCFQNIVDTCKTMVLLILECGFLPLLREIETLLRDERRNTIEMASCTINIQQNFPIKYVSREKRLFTFILKLPLMSLHTSINQNHLSKRCNYYISATRNGDHFYARLVQ